jgi:TonB family protein
LEEIGGVETCRQHVEERIDLVVAEPRARNGIGIAIAASLVLHAALVILFLTTYRPLERPAENVPIARYVDLIRQNPQTFTEAPGPAVERGPIAAPFSDANRKASMPEPTGEKPTTRPGTESGLYVPPMARGEAAPSSSGEANTTAGQPPSSVPEVQPGTESPSRIPALRTADALGGVNLRSAIREIGKVASLGGQGGQPLDLTGVAGGEKGFAEQGPLSFETQWYDWGEYAQSMVSKIRLHWYENMPQLLRTGLKGIVTIRFTIQRDGRITDITLLRSSTIPPYDFAARKAIELASPLNPLPADFPNSSERVTAIFYYNSTPPER